MAVLADSSPPAPPAGPERAPAVAGMFYAGDTGTLHRDVAALLEQGRDARPASAPVPKAVIAPHAGHVYSGALAARAYALLEPARRRLRRIVLIGPSHRVAFRGLALSGAAAWRTPLGPVPIDRDWARQRLAGLPEVSVLDRAHAREHSLEVHLPFLQALLEDFALVPLAVGRADAGTVARALDALWGGPETAIIVSSDLSHFLDYDACREIDTATATAIEALDADGRIGPHEACGCTPVNGLLALARSRGLSVRRLGLMNSGDSAGSRDRVVGYGAWAFHEPPAGVGANVAPSDATGATGAAGADGDDPAAATGRVVQAHGPALIALAARGLRHGVEHATPPPALNLDAEPEALRAPGAAFVTLTQAQSGDLRGCIGSVEAHRPLARDVLGHGFDAGFRDPRFPPVRQDELAGLSVSVSVLTPPVPLAVANRADLLARLRPGVDGIILQEGRRRGLFLPQVWEQLPDSAVFLAHLLRKAGLPSDHWSDTMRAFRFETRGVKGRPWASAKGSP